MSFRSSKVIHFYDVDELEEVVHSFSVAPHRPGRLCTFLSSTLLYEDHSQTPHVLKSLDCSTVPIESATDTEFTNLELECSMHDMCCLGAEEKDYFISTNGYKGVFTYTDDSDQLDWNVKGRLTGMKKDVSLWGVTSDGHGHLLLCDTENRCIQMLSLIDGRYMGDVLREGEQGLGQPWRIHWCTKTAICYIVHKKGQDWCISMVEDTSASHEKMPAEVTHEELEEELSSPEMKTNEDMVEEGIQQEPIRDDTCTPENETQSRLEVPDLIPEDRTNTERQLPLKNMAPWQKRKVANLSSLPDSENTFMNKLHPWRDEPTTPVMEIASTQKLRLHEDEQLLQNRQQLHLNQTDQGQSFKMSATEDPWRNQDNAQAVDLTDWQENRHVDKELTLQIGQQQQLSPMVEGDPSRLSSIDDPWGSQAMTQGPEITTLQSQQRSPRRREEQVQTGKEGERQHHSLEGQPFKLAAPGQDSDNTAWPRGQPLSEELVTAASKEQMHENEADERQTCKLSVRENSERWPWRNRTPKQVKSLPALQPQWEQLGLQIREDEQEMSVSLKDGEQPPTLLERENPEKWPWRKSRLQRSVSESVDRQENIAEKHLLKTSSLENVKSSHMSAARNVGPILGIVPQGQLPAISESTMPEFSHIQSDPHLFPIVSQMVPPPHEIGNRSGQKEAILQMESPTAEDRHVRHESCSQERESTSSHISQDGSWQGRLSQKQTIAIAENEKVPIRVKWSAAAEAKKRKKAEIRTRSSEKGVGKLYEDVSDSDLSPTEELVAIVGRKGVEPSEDIRDSNEDTKTLKQSPQRKLCVEEEVRRTDADEFNFKGNRCFCLIATKILTVFMLLPAFNNIQWIQYSMQI